MAELATDTGIRKKWIAFLCSLALAIALTYLVKEPQFSDSQVYALFLLFFSIALWVTEAIPPFSVGLFILAFLAFSFGNPRFNSEPRDVAKYVNTFSSSVVWLMLGGFFLAAALTKTRLDSDLFKLAIKLSGSSQRKILIGLMIATMVGSMLMSNTAITAMLIAAVMPLLKNLGQEAPLSKALLVGIPLAATTGGLSTVIGTPANLIAVGALENAGIQIDFLTWMGYGVPLALILTALGIFTLNRIFLKTDQPVSLDFLETRDNASTDPSMKSKRTIVMIITGITVLLWITSSLHNLSVSAVAAIPIVFLTMTGILKAKDINALSWDTLLLVAGGLSLSLALQETGLLNHYAQKIVSVNIHHMVFLFVLSYSTMLLANVMSHTATSTIMIPLGMAILPQLKTEVALIIGLASSMALFLPVSTPANAVAFSTGMMQQKDFRIGGFLLGILGPAIVIFWVLLIRS